MRLRKLLALADKGWTSTELYWQLIKSPTSCLKRYFTSFLSLAIALHLIGALISPLEALLLSSRTRKIPRKAEPVPFMYPFPDFPLRTDDIATSALSALHFASVGQYQPLIWETGNEEDRYTLELGEIDPSTDPFVSGLPKDFSTGVLRQFAPRFNTSVKVKFPAEQVGYEDCKSASSFQKYYNGTGWFVGVCVPVSWFEDIWQSPWKCTRDRQDISEEMYLSFGFGFDSNPNWEFHQKYHRILLRVLANTTSGWFELPSYMKSQRPGPLYNKDPIGIYPESELQASLPMVTGNL